MKNTVFPHKFWRPFLDCMPQLFFRPQYVWFPIHLKGHLIPLCYETLVVNWQNWLFTLFHQSRSVLSPNPINRYLVTPSSVNRVLLGVACSVPSYYLNKCWLPFTRANVCEILIKIKTVHSTKWIRKFCPQNDEHFVQSSEYAIFMTH